MSTTPDASADRPEVTGRDGDEPSWRRRRRLDELFGDVLPETTGDERDQDLPASTGDDWWREQVPPHHGG